MELKILHAAMFTPAPGGRWGLPLLLEGDPGVAKTTIVLAYGAEWGLYTHILSPALHGEGAFGVVPVPKDGHLSYPAPDYSVELADGGIIAVDEATSAPPALQAPVMGLICDRKVGNHQFGPRVRTIGMCNPVELAANGYDLPAPLANRFGHLRWDAPSVSDHAAYMLGGAGEEDVKVKDARVEEQRVLSAWPEAWAQAVGLETAFLGAQGHWKNKCPKAGDPGASKAWPSDRTWEYATRAHAGAACHKLSQTHRDQYITAFIGAAAYEAWATMIEQADMPRASDVLDGKVKFEWEKKRLDRSAAIIAACTALVVPVGGEKRAARANTLWGMLAGASAYDITVPAAQALVKVGLHVSKEALPVLSKLNPALKAAGIRSGENF